ncbi:hypothetical protein PRZ48_009490 [Zasmidium cellare]|uniref:DUF7730 domain-containing protein n=1 Tax=Zasmidium cellare TaxID=395010 RepID=A0ABR0EBW1_ZASCE|nr:hypothetical protein PRZ48_009490 [Zasmidium cellare]
MVTQAAESCRSDEDERAIHELENSSSKLLSLPAEVRNQIYAELLPCDEIWHITGETYYEIRQSNSKPDKKAFVKDDKPDDMNFDDRLALSRCCKQLRKEVLRYFYGFNSFVLPIAPEAIDGTRQWLSSRPAEMFAVTRKVYLQQAMRRCHRYRTPWYERLLSIDFKTLEIEIIGKLRHCSGCLERYERQVERAKERRPFKQLKETWADLDLSEDQIMQLAKMFQRRPSSSKSEEEEDAALAGLVLLFEEV